VQRRFATQGLLLACLAIRSAIKAEVGLFSRIRLDEHTPYLRALLGIIDRKVKALDGTITRLRGRLKQMAKAP
jgi:hypothetical protein